MNAPDETPGHPPLETPADRYPTVDDLAARARTLVRRFRGRCRLRRVGSSRAGEPLWLLSAGRAPEAVLVVAGAHANEPVGCATVLHLAERVCREQALRAGLSWHFLLCLDPDGARLNAGWVREPQSVERYFRDFFRPAGAAQPEWLPHAGTPPLPETHALLRVLDELRPLAQFTLHATDAGGAWVQLTRDVPDAPRLLARTAGPLKIPLETAPFDVFHWPSPGPGVFLMPPPGQRHGGSPPYDLSARSTWFHPVPYGTVTAIVEAPMWVSDAVCDDGPAADPESRLRRAVATLRMRGEQVGALLRETLPPAGPLAAAATAAMSASAIIAADWWAGRRGRMAGDGSAANLASLQISAQRIPLRAAAMLRRALPEGPARRAVADLVSEWCREYEADFGLRWIPVRDQVELQAATVLTLTRRVRALHRHPALWRPAPA